MGRGDEDDANRIKKRRTSYKDKGSDDSDDDYVLDEDEESNCSEEFVAFAEDYEDDEELGKIDISSDEDNEVVNLKQKQKQKVVRSKNSKPENKSSGRKRTRVGQPSKKTRVSDDDDEDYCEFDDIEDEEYVEFDDEVVKQKVATSLNLEKDSLNSKKPRVRQANKKTRTSDDDEEYCDFDEEDDEDDEEFALDGIDFVDEDEDLQEVKKKSKKTTKRGSRKKISVKGQKRKRKTKVSTKPLRKKKRGILGVRKPAESSDEDFVDTIQKNIKKRNKRTVTDWDSDSACSKSSDLEYTISEEEKESLVEAMKFCGELRTSSRNSSPVNRSHVDGARNAQQEKPMRRLRKGKATVSNLQSDSGKQVCGICLSEEGNGIVRGTLDCCSHYFCFACIMEWSKVESRCPLCKQRFMSITRSPRSNVGIDLRTSVVQVPKRDQVYRPSEEEVRGYFDPYENVLCMECHQGGDDNLMLLCDICDSPAHTYCVGLQREVPEGNWYCEGCRISEAGSSNAQVRNPVVDHDVLGNCSLPTSLSTHRINSEVLVSPPQHSVSVPQSSLSHGFGNLQSPRYPFHAPSPSGAGVSTLSGRRRVHRQVHDRFTINRENQTSEVFGRTAVTPEIDLNREVNFESEQCEERTDRCSRNLLISDNIHTDFEEWIQQREPNSARPSQLRQLASLGASTTITSGSAHATLRSEHCSSMGSDDSISPHTTSYRENSYIHGESAK